MMWARADGIAACARGHNRQRLGIPQAFLPENRILWRAADLSRNRTHRSHTAPETPESSSRAPAVVHREKCRCPRMNRSVEEDCNRLNSSSPQASDSRYSASPEREQCLASAIELSAQV